jgi:hypothetical protein
MIHSESKTSNKFPERETSPRDKATSIIAEAGCVGVPLGMDIDAWLSIIGNICNQLCDEMIFETRSAYWYEVKREVNKYIDDKRKNI